MDNSKPSAIILGDYSNAIYHPLKGVDCVLRDLLSENFSVTCTEDRNMLELKNLKDFKLCIMYVDSWKSKLEQNEMGGLLSFTAQGGGLLVIHNGISYQSNPEYAQMVGARFTGHPPYQLLNYSIKDSRHPITQDIESFEMEEELYMFDFDTLSSPAILLECCNNDICMPAAWAHTYGLGRIAYLAPGHNVESFLHPAYRKVVLRSASWATKEI